MERCPEHPTVVGKVEEVQIGVAELREATKNIDRALLQVMDELKTRKLTPAVTWIIGVMAGTIGSMGMFILEHLVPRQ